MDFEAEAGGLVSHLLPAAFERRFIYVYRGGDVFESRNPGTASIVSVPAQARNLLIVGRGSKIRALAGNGGLGFCSLPGSLSVSQWCSKGPSSQLHRRN